MPKGVEHRKYILKKGAPEILHPSLMPKGVEHNSNKQKEFGKDCLHPSLMPKGVEHMFQAVASGFLGVCTHL